MQLDFLNPFKVVNTKISSASLAHEQYLFRPTLVIFRCLSNCLWNCWAHVRDFKYGGRGGHVLVHFPKCLYHVLVACICVLIAINIWTDGSSIRKMHTFFNHLRQHTYDYHVGDDLELPGFRTIITTHWNVLMTPYWPNMITVIRSSNRYLGRKFLWSGFGLLYSFHSSRHYPSSYLLFKT
jgi:hypothetical protein